MHLTYEDYGFLLEALEAKAKEATSNGMTAGLLGMMFSKDSDQAEDRLTTAMDEATEKNKSIEERVVLLKAKIITLRDREMISNLESNIEKE